MNKRNHFFFKINRDDFLTESNIEKIVRNLTLPKNKFPTDFFYKENGLFIAGYFVSYYPKITSSRLMQLCKGNKWREISKIIGDFIILYCDLTSRKLLVLTDQTGKFPCYFSLTDKEFIMSTSFNKVANSLADLTLDVPEALDYIHRNMGVKDTTIIKEIKQVPPATLLHLSEEWKCSLFPMIDPQEILGQPFEKYESIEEFTNSFLSNLEMIIRERLGAVGKLQFCSELSSGFDSPLVAYLLKKNISRPFTCYSHTFKLDPGYTNPDAVKEFAKGHRLKIRIISHDHLFPFSAKEDLEWMENEPVGQTGMADAYYDFRIKSKEGNRVCFEGHGGDEIYRMDEKTIQLNLTFPIQVEYFERLELDSFGIDKVLTKKGLGALFDKKRFESKSAYYLGVADSAATVYFNNFFPILWETKVWPVTPFIDPRLVQIARGIPKPNNGHLMKQEIWKHRMDIFVPGQFIRKRGPDEQFKRYLTEKSDLVIKILQNSLLGARGWAKSSEIIDDLKKKNIEKYTGDDAMSYIVNLVGIEYFIQQNKVKVA